MCTAGLGLAKEERQPRPRAWWGGCFADTSGWERVPVSAGGGQVVRREGRGERQ